MFDLLTVLYYGRMQVFADLGTSRDNPDKLIHAPAILSAAPLTTLLTALFTASVAAPKYKLRSKWDR